MPDIWETVTDSQVFGWMDNLNRMGFPTTIISFATKIVSVSQKRKIENKIGGNFYQYKQKKMFINDIFTVFILFLHYIKVFGKTNKIIFQTRVSNIAVPLVIIKFLPKTRIIFDARGAHSEEFAHNHNLNNLNLLKKIKYLSLKLNEKLLVINSDLVFCVSNSLKKYYIKKYNQSLKRFKVIPGAGDGELFYFNHSERQQLRKQYRVENKIIFIYAGKLEMKWEIPDEIFLFFKQISNQNNNALLYLLTPDIMLAKKLRKKYGFESDCVKIKSVDYSDVRPYLNMADIALLLRENVLMNNVASPTKFAEYLLCGLPVIISDAILDFAEIVKNFNFGVAISDFQPTPSVNSFINLVHKQDKILIANWASSNLSKECYLKNIVDTFCNI